MSKHLAVDPNGTKHTRNSEKRTYTHTVVARMSQVEHTRASISPMARKTHRSNFDYYLKWVDRDPKTIERPHWRSEEKHQEHLKREIENAENHLKGIRDRDQWVEMRVQEDLDVIKQRIAKGYYEVYHNQGWCGSYDLALKLKTTAKNRGWVDVTILPAEIVG